MTLAAGCDVNRALKEQSEARRLSSDLLVQFTRAADAANRAVMADTDATSVEFAREAEQARKGVQSDVDALRPVLQGLKFADEGRLLHQFVSRFAQYSALDRHVLELAVENTNLKAQRLSSGPAQEAADSLRDALGAVVAAAPANAWQVKALEASALASVRESRHCRRPTSPTPTTMPWRDSSNAWRAPRPPRDVRWQHSRHSSSRRPDRGSPPPRRRSTGSWR